MTTLNRRLFASNLINSCCRDDPSLTKRCLNLSFKNLNKYGNYTPSVAVLLKVIERNNKNKLIYPEKVVSSSGSVLVIVFDNFVIKLFQNLHTFNRAWKVLYSIRDENCNHIINMIDYLSMENKIINVKIHLIVTEKLTPLITYIHNDRILDLKENEIFKLFKDIGIALDCINEYGYVQGDCTLDNIGRIDENFVLFDFNCASSIKTRNDDINVLLRSARFNFKNISKKMNEFFNFVKNSKTASHFIDKIYQYCAEYDIVI